MIALDTNVLVYAHRADSPFHAAASAAVSGLAGSGARWGIPWPCVGEFYSVVTHPRGYRPPTSPAAAVDQVAAWLEAPAVALLDERDGTWPVLWDLLATGAVRGPRVHDARIAAICLEHRVRELWTVDRDFAAFPVLRTRNPLVDSAM